MLYVLLAFVALGLIWGVLGLIGAGWYHAYYRERLGEHLIGNELVLLRATAIDLIKYGPFTFIYSLHCRHYGWNFSLTPFVRDDIEHG